MRNILRCTVPLVGLWAAAVAYGHEEIVHLRISDTAYRYLVSEDPSRPRLDDILRIIPGAELEDAGFRPLFHFLPPLNQPAQIIQFIGPTGPVFVPLPPYNTTCSSVQWAFFENALCQLHLVGATAPFPSLTNGHTWHAATASADSSTGVPTRRSWDHLGYVIHLLQDLTSPAHTRNDDHLSFAVFDWHQGDLDPFEMVNKRAFPGAPLAGSPFGAPDPATFTEAEQFFTALRAFTASKFFSNDTVFASDLAGPCISSGGEGIGSVCTWDPTYFYADCLSSDDPSCHGDRRKVARKGIAYHLRGSAHAHIDSVIAREQFAVLGRIAASYTVAFVRFFAPKLDLEIEPREAGGVVSARAGIIDCGFERTLCSELILNGTEVALDVAENPGYKFTSWEGDCSGSEKRFSLIVNKDVKCKAVFGEEPELTVVLTGAGSVSSIPPGINCGASGSSCTAHFPVGSLVTLTARESDGTVFAGWSQGCEGDSLVTSINLNSDTTCEANFAGRMLLTVSKEGTGSGAVVSDPSGIDCGAACSSQTAAFGGSVRLTASADFGSVFKQWGGQCEGTSNTVTVELSVNKACTVEFDQPPAIRLAPFGMQSLSDGPFLIEVINNIGWIVLAPQDITVTLLREVVSPCRGVLFSSNRTITVPQGQSSIAALDAAGRDPLCNTSPTRTEWTVRGATMGGGPLDLSDVRIQELFVSISR